ncbi:MAG: AAA family ATPase [Sphingobacteriales bacterium]|nr:AAA family ATPase [Sphingobacteriales bacterium]
MYLQKASRKKAKIKLALQGPSGSGKSIGALLIAFGLCGNWSKIAVIDTENHSADLYSDLGDYNTISIAPPFSPEKYIQAIKLCEESKMEVVIIDSVSHEWDGSGGILDIHSGMSGNSFTNWGKLTHRHNAFVQTMLQSPCHIIGTIRSKQDYVLNEKNGKIVPEKVGLKGVQRDGLDYEFTIVFDIDSKHNAVVSKDRTSLFINVPEFRIGVETGKQINEWCLKGEDITQSVMEGITLEIVSEEQLLQQIHICDTVDKLLALFNKHPIYQETHLSHFTNRRKELSSPGTDSSILNSFKISENGTHANT